MKTRELFEQPKPGSFKSLNDDDYYVVDNDAKTVITYFGSRKPTSADFDRATKNFPGMNIDIIKGMRAKFNFTWNKVE